MVSVSNEETHYNDLWRKTCSATESARYDAGAACSRAFNFPAGNFQVGAGGEAVPETANIVQLSLLFGVTMDYLLIEAVSAPASSTPSCMPPQPRAAAAYAAFCISVLAACLQHWLALSVSVLLAFLCSISLCAISITLLVYFLCAAKKVGIPPSPPHLCGFVSLTGACTTYCLLFGLLSLLGTSFGTLYASSIPLLMIPAALAAVFGGWVFWELAHSD